MAPLSCPTRGLVLAAAHLASQAQAALPNIDFDALGSVGLAGNFAGLQLWDSSYASTSQSLNDSGADAASSLWLRNGKDGDLQYLGSTDPGGSILALCQASSDSDASGLLFLGGNFTSVNGTQASHVAAYDPDQQQFFALAGGLDGQVLALACHDDSNTLFVGGSFTAPEDADSDDDDDDADSYGGSVASWSYTDQAWSSLPFGGLNGPVYSIEPAGSDDSVLFAGNFTISVSNTTNTRLSSDNPAADFESLGSALSPISLNTSRVWAGPGGSGSPHELFCPDGDGQSGSQWTVEGQDPPIIVVRTDQAHQVRGLRIGNTFQNRGTSQFKVISVPDSIVQTFTYLSDPTDIDSPLTTCDWECPLSDDPSVAYEDFLFQEGTNITGFQINLDDYYGDGAGLHQLTLLSSGGFAYADSSLNSNASNSCGSGVAGQSPSSSSVEGDWTATTVPSSIDGVDTSALVASVDTGASQSDSPSITFSPNIVAKTDYDVFLVTPGCADMGNCDARTSVQVSADSGTGNSDSTTVSQTNQEQQSALVYSGELTAGATFTLRLASDPEGSGSGGEYALVAGYIQLVAQDTSATRISDQDGRGLFEYVLSGSDGVFGDGAAAASSDVNVAEDSVTNATAFTQLALSFNSSSDASVRSVVYHNQVAYFGGTFEAGENVSTTNVAAFGGDLGADSPVVPNGGLDGPVRALLVVGDWLYAAGSFDGTEDESVSGLGGIARWDTTKSDGSWSTLEGGDAPFFDDGFAKLSSAKIDGDDVLVAVAASSSSSGGRSPIALWNTSSKEWTDEGLPFIAGTTSAVAASDTDEGSLFFAGRISSALSSSFSGATRLTTNSSGQPSLQPYGFSFSNPSSAESSSDGEPSDPTLRQKRATSTFNVIQKRAPTEVTSLPTPISQTTEPQILTGAFYSEGDSDVIVLGGRFSTENGVDNIGIYDTDSQGISALADSNSIDGTVRALRVVDDTVWIGGQFTTQDGSAGLIRYKLDEEQWNPIAAAMNPYDDMNVTVTSLLTTEAQASEVLVAGSFASVGSLTCLSICLYNADDNQWSALGSGLNGFIAALDYAGDNSQFIYAAGSFELNDTPAYLARWNRDENEWSLLGDANALPGPATAVASNDQDEKRIFVAGVSSDGSEPYLMFWNGESWADAGSNALQEGTEFQHIGFVPLSHDEDDHDEDLIQNDRLLMVSGDLDFADYGRVSSALFDGMTWTPFLVSSTGSGDSGIISSFFYSASTFTLSPSYLSVGIVILISIAISLGVVFLVVIIGLLVALHQRRSDNNNNAASAKTVAGGYNGDDEEETNRRPTSLLATLNAATAMMTAEKMNGHQKRETQASRYDDSESIDEQHFAAARQSMGSDGGQQYVYEDDEADLVRMRYSFEAEQPGELTVGAGEELRVLDKSSEDWYFIERTDGSNDRGVVPASFLY